MNFDKWLKTTYPYLMPTTRLERRHMRAAWKAGQRMARIECADIAGTMAEGQNSPEFEMALRIESEIRRTIK